MRGLRPEGASAPAVGAWANTSVTGGCSLSLGSLAGRSLAGSFPIGSLAWAMSGGRISAASDGGGEDLSWPPDLELATNSSRATHAALHGLMEFLFTARMAGAHPTRGRSRVGTGLVKSHHRQEARQDGPNLPEFRAAR